MHGIKNRKGKIKRKQKPI